MRLHFTLAAALGAACLSSAVSAQVLFQTGSDIGFFTPFNSANADTVKYGDSGWLGGPGAIPMALGRFTFNLATFGGDGINAGTTDIEFTLNDGDPSGLVFGTGAVLYSKTLTGVVLPASSNVNPALFELVIPLPSVMTTGGFNNVGWSIKLRNYNYSGQFGFQVGSCNVQYVGFYTNNASYWNGTSWSLFAFGADTCQQIAQYSVMIEAPDVPFCPADLNGDFVVDGTDLGLLLGGWGQPGVSDLNGDGTTDGTDLGLLLGSWGPCA